MSLPLYHDSLSNKIGVGMNRPARLGSKPLKKKIEFGHLKEMTHAYLWAQKKKFALSLKNIRTGPECNV
jgi:hypothetical protein